MEHPDVINTTEYDYAEIKEWANDATEEEVREFLAENFPQALEPVEVEVEEVAEEPAKKAPSKRQSPAKKTTTSEDEDVVVSPGETVSDEDKKKAKEMADDLGEFDD